MPPIAGFFGLQGSGKTMLMTRYALHDYYEKGLDIYSNYHLKHIEYTPIVTLEDINKIKNGVFLADELWLWLFSRTSMTKMNQELMKIVMLNRKRNVAIYYTAQLKRSIDVMLREVTTIWVYPQIIRCEDKNGNPVKGLQYYITDGRIVKDYLLKKPLSFYGRFYDTREEIGDLNRDETPLQKGIGLEKRFARALSKLKSIKHYDVLPNSGSNTSWNYDVVAYIGNKTLAFDVKGVSKSRVYLNCYGKELQKNIQNAYSHNAMPYLAFPMNDKKQLSNPNYWYVYGLNNYSYLLMLSSDPAYKKLVSKSTKLPMLNTILE